LTDVTAPDLGQIQRAHSELQHLVRQTPTWQWQAQGLRERMPADCTVHLKLELFQHAGSFKPRGALCVMRELDAAALRRGVTAVSAGNHAMAVAYAATRLGSHAKVAMPKSADPSRIEACRRMGAEVVLTDDIASAFEAVERMRDEEGRHFVHPFEGPATALGTATLGYEFLRQVGQLDVLYVPIGGGGLCAGMAAATKQLQPRCRVIGIEPLGADSMHRSFASGRPERIERVGTIADSLGAPYAMPYSFALCRRYVDELVAVSDDELRAAMLLLFQDMKLAVEPAGAAATAAMLQQADQRGGQRIGVIVCGGNVAPTVFAQCIQQAIGG
jgi:threonine dehydratase